MSTTERTAALYDADIRRRLITYDLRQQAAAGARIVEEFGIYKGAVRADVAVIGEASMVGFEIKSPRDNLDRLRIQAMLYGYVFDRCNLVADPDMVSSAMFRLPDWWGLWSAVPSQRSRGGVRIACERPAKRNPELSKRHLAVLLWKGELQEELRQRGITKGLWRPNQALESQLMSLTSMDEIRAIVRRRLRNRPTDWLAGGAAEAG